MDVLVQGERERVREGKRKGCVSGREGGGGVG